MSHKVLLFDSDAVSLSAMRDLLHRSLCQVGCGQTIDDVTALATAHDWDVAIVDLLSDQSVGLEVLRKLRQLPRPPACVVTLRFGHETWKSEAMALGAFYCIEQPLTAPLLVALIHATAEARRSDVDQMEPGGVVCHALSRWADVVVRGADSPNDPRTLADWGHAVAVSTGALRNWCRTAGISARGSLLLARTLRAVIKQSSTAAAPEDLLNIVDRRTLAKVLKAAGGTDSALPTSVQDLLERQTFVSNRSAIRIVAAVLHARRRRALDCTDSTQSRRAVRVSLASDVPASTSPASIRHFNGDGDFLSEAWPSRKH